MEKKGEQKRGVGLLLGVKVEGAELTGGGGGRDFQRKREGGAAWGDKYLERKKNQEQEK